MSGEANVKPIRIMLKTNITSQKEDVPFTKALLVHPDYPGLSGTDGFNEYPYISDNVSIPDRLNSASYFERVQFFFDKDKFRSLTSDQPIKPTESGVLQENIHRMLSLLFLTAIPVSENIKDSFSMVIKPDNDSWFPKFKFTKESAMEFMNTYYFSYLQIGSSEYTVNRIVWLNDVINNPTYSTLFNEFETFKTSSIGMLNKLLADKKRLFIRLLEIFKESLDDYDKPGSVAPTKNGFKDGVYKSSYTSTNKIKDAMSNDLALRRSNRLNSVGNQITDQLSTYKTKLIRVEEFQNKVANIGKLAWYLDKISNEDDDAKIQTKLTSGAASAASATNAQKTLEADIAKLRRDMDKLRGNKSPKQHDIDRLNAEIADKEARIPDAIISDSDANSQLESSKMQTSLANQSKTLAENASSKSVEFLTDKKTLLDEHKKLQEAIDSLNIDRINILMEGILRDDPAALEEPLKEFVGRIYKLYKQNKESIALEVYRISKSDDNQSTSNAYIKGASEKMKTFTSDERKLLPYFDKTSEIEVPSYIQILIDNYVYNKKDAEKTIDDFIARISNLKKQNKSCTDKCTDFYIGVSQLQSVDPKIPTYEITVQCDVFGGVLDATNIKRARCNYTDKKLTKQFINWRRNIQVNKLKVMPGPFFDLKDIKTEPKTVKQRPVAPVKRGRQTQKRRPAFRRK